jgi:hypothetical protein
MKNYSTQINQIITRYFIKNHLIFINNIFLFYFFYRSDVNISDQNTLKSIFLTQSQNAEAKIALCFDEFTQNYIELEMHRNHDWNKIEDNVLYTNHEVFAFWNHIFYFRMFKILIDNLIATGVMKHLVEKYYTKKWKFEKFVESRKVFSVQDLAFGFHIWLWCCLMSFLGFLAELIYKRLNSPRKKPKPIKFAKVHPILIENEEVCIPKKNLDKKLVQKFRIKSSAVEDVEEHGDNLESSGPLSEIVVSDIKDIETETT